MIFRILNGKDQSEGNRASDNSSNCDDQQLVVGYIPSLMEAFHKETQPIQCYEASKHTD